MYRTNPLLMWGSGWGIGIGIERLTPGGLIPWWWFAVVGLVSLALGLALRLPKKE